MISRRRPGLPEAASLRFRPLPDDGERDGREPAAAAPVHDHGAVWERLGRDAQAVADVPRPHVADRARRDEVDLAVHPRELVGELAGLLATESSISKASADGLTALLQLYGDDKVLTEAAKAMKAVPGALAALDDLRWLATHVASLGGGVAVGFDLADLRGYAYYSGTRFAIYGQGAELARGGRYDEVGAVFGRRRPAVGFSLDLKELVSVLAPRPLKAAVRAPWGEAVALRQAIASLRAQGETVACVLPGHEHEVNEFDCDRELAEVAGQWVVRSLPKAPA